MAHKLANTLNKDSFRDISLIHNSLPELNYEEVDTTVRFLNKELSMPLMINAITGGIDEAVNLNSDLAELAGRFGLGMAVGSQTIALEAPSQATSFDVVRAKNPHGLVLANLSANSALPDVLQAIDMIGADGIQLHLNVPQELAMMEGDRDFRGLLNNIGEMVRLSPVPVIVKEVGFGISRETGLRLFDLGVKWIDVGGRGGTNFVSIEQARSGIIGDELTNWGLSTATSIVELASLNLPINIVGSGGIRNGLDVALAVALGAEIAGMAGELLRVWMNGGREGLEQKFVGLSHQLKSVMLMTGSRNIDQLRKQALVISGESAHWLSMRGVDVSAYAQR